MKYALPALLAILQQAEYDRAFFWRWTRTQRPPEEQSRLNEIQPDRWTPKLRFIRRLAGILAPLVGAARAVAWTSFLTELPQHLLTSIILWSAARRLRAYQQNGLTVIAVAGSYGKTTAKQHLRHLLGSNYYTLLTPESINTPLGIAAVVKKKLSPQHAVFIVEFGEQKVGDLGRLTSFVRPDIAVVTPIGFAHSEHFGSEGNVKSAFGELARHRHRPALFLVDDNNRGIFKPDSEVIWYGKQVDSPFRLTAVKSTFPTTTATLFTPQGKRAIETHLWGEHQLVSCLPGIALLSGDSSMADVAPMLQYLPSVPRRLEVHQNPNGTLVVDNSYNTNPGSWRAMQELIQSLSPKKVIVITAGFVEIDPATAENEHVALGQDLIEKTAGTIIIRTRYNKDLRQRLSQHSEKNHSFRFAEANSLAEALEVLAENRWPLDILWLEGGSRELYQ